MTLQQASAGGVGAQNFFAMFGLPVRYAIDLTALDSAWRAVQAAVHPDRFAAGTDAQRRLALQWSTQINEAHDTLKDSVRRAAYLCQLKGVEVDAERNTAMPADFLVQQMEWRESLDDASTAKDLRAISQLGEEVSAAMAETELLLEHLLDAPTSDPERAAQEVRRMMFLKKFNDQLISEQQRIARGASADR